MLLKQMPRQTYYTLDWLRGFAAVAVMSFHLQILQGFAPLFSRAYLAVDMFFLMSGFVLAHAYGAKLEAGLRVSQFFKLRVRRLYPLYLISTAVGVAAIAAAGKFSLGYLAALPFSIFFLPFPPVGLGGTLYPFNPAAWSLFYELAINLLLPLLWPRPKLRLAILILSLVGLIAGSLHYGSLDQGFRWAGAPLALCRVTFSFLLGVIVYENQEQICRISLPPIFATLLMAGLLLSDLGINRSYADASTVIFLFPLILSASVRQRHSRPFEKIATFSGDISYPLYAIHEPIIMLCMAAAPILAREQLALLLILCALAYVLGKVFGSPRSKAK